MHHLRVNELLVGDVVTVGIEAQTLLREATMRADVWVEVGNYFYRVIYTGAYNYLTILKTQNDPINNMVCCEVLYSAPENRNIQSETVLVAYRAKEKLANCHDDLLTTYCY